MTLALLTVALLVGVGLGLLTARSARPPAARAQRSTRSEPPEITAAKTISCALRELDGPRACRRVLTPVWDSYITEPEEVIELARRARETAAREAAQAVARARPVQVVMPILFDESAVRH